MCAQTLTFWERGVVIIQKLLAIERLEALQDPVPNPTSADGTNDFSLEIEGVPGNLRDVPVATFNHFVSRHEVPDEQEDRHHDVLCD